MTKPISISSCHKCEPNLWDVIKKSKDTYKCKGCGKTINVVLLKKGRNKK